MAHAMAPAEDKAATRALGWVSELADQPPLVALNSLTLAAGLVLGKPRLARAGARMLTAHLLATGMKHFVKRRIDRTRPYVVVNGGQYEMTAGDSEASEVNSFPSGHTAGAVAVARAYSREYPEHRGTAVAAATAAALIQIPRCSHYPSDVAAGAAIGALAEFAVDRSGQRLFAWIETVARAQARKRAERRTDET